VELITPRVPQVDWSRGFPRHWNGGDPVATHFFNALSFLFPRGERFFVDQARELGKDDPAVRAFGAQEAIHAHQHAQYNAVLAEQGYENVSDDLARRLENHAYRVFAPLTRLAVVCAYEHYTAALGDYVLRERRPPLEHADPQMQLIWGWHAAEETEHKAVCFDLYCRAGGTWARRTLILLMVTINFSRLFWRLYLHMLRRDGCFSARRFVPTLLRIIRTMIGPGGVGWPMAGAILRYLNPWFHPWKQDNRATMQAWLEANASRLRPVA
jgi:predicted metal-dependent hydrolase